MTVPINSHAIIIGSMKSGTSSLYHYLIQHPEICAAKIKEPEFFSENQQHKLKCDVYSDLWEFDLNKHKIALEASTGYTKYPLELNVPKNIFEYGIRPKLIYSVRHPIQRIISQHEYAKNFAHWGNQKILSDQLIKLSSYYLQLLQFRRYFPKDDILIVDFDDISTNAQKTVNQVFGFLRLPSRLVDTSTIYNKGGETDPLGRAIEGRSNKTEISRVEESRIFSRLRSDMNSFRTEYNFDVAKWGF